MTIANKLKKLALKSQIRNLEAAQKTALEKVILVCRQYAEVGELQCVLKLSANQEFVVPVETTPQGIEEVVRVPSVEALAKQLKSQGFNCATTSIQGNNTLIIDWSTS